MSFSFGRIYGGPEGDNTPFGTTLEKLLKIIGARQVGLLAENEGELNVVFMIYGSLGGPKFRGPRTGKFSREEKTLMVQIAVPTDHLNSETPERFIFQSLRKSVELGRLTFRAAKIPFAADEHLHLIEQIERDWKDNSGTRP